MKTATKGLGKGLDALFGEQTSNFSSEQDASGFSMIETQMIEPNPNQPRKKFDGPALEELAQSIKEHGVLSPITVRKRENGYYQIVAGERRWRASRQAGLAQMPAMVIEADDKLVMELALIENLQREDLNPIEEAEGYYILMKEFGLTQDVVAQRVNKSRPMVANSLRLLSLHETVQQFLMTGSLSTGHGRAIAGMKNTEDQEAIARRVIAEKLSVRQTEAVVRKQQRNKEKTAKAMPGVDYTTELSKQVEAVLGRRVKIIPGDKKGTVELEYYGTDDLERLCQALKEVNV